MEKTQEIEILSEGKGEGEAKPRFDMVGCGESIVDHLAAAFGGYSHVSDRIVGEALYGRANNSSVEWTAEEVVAVADAAAAKIFARWEDCGADLDKIRADIRIGYIAAHSHYSGHTPAIPMP